VIPTDEYSISDVSVSTALEPTRRLRGWQRFQSRLLGYLLALSVLTSVAAGSIYYSRQVKFVEAEQAERGQTLIGNLAGQSELGAYSGDAGFLTAPLRRAFLERDVSFACVYNRRGELLIQLVKPEVKVDPTLPAGLLDELTKDPSRPPFRLHQREYEDLVAPVVSVKGDPEEDLFGTTAGTRPLVTIGVARLGLSRRPAQEKLDEVLRWGIYLTLIVLVMGATAALILARRVSRPILALAHGADKIRRGTLGYQLPLKRSDELGLLADSFNRMSSKLYETVESLEHLNRNLEDEVSRRTVALRRSRDFIALLNAPLQLRKLLDSALDALLGHSHAVSGAIFLREGQNRLQVVVSQGALADAFSAPSSLQPVTEVASTRRLRLVEALPVDSPLRADSAGAVLLCVPVEYRERLEAVLVLCLDSPPKPDLTEFVEHAASQLAIAVSNARAYSATERLAQELERRNLALLQQRDQLQEMSRIKSEFVANISHELRTPLNAIIGYTELLAEGVYGPLADTAKQRLADITENADNLQQLIDQILDLSKMEAGKMTISLDEVDLKQLVQDVVDFSAPLCKDRPYDVGAELPDGPLPIRTDPGKVRQILVNLVGNAIKFTEQGSVTVSLSFTDLGDVALSVKDTGMGIRPEHLRVIFDEFRQVDGSSTRKHGGTGLGLAISKKFATLLGGEIKVESAQGKGSCFTLLLPRARVVSRVEGPELPVTIGESDAG
jgi:signal transduction histidine kinase/HAMP domain-containing protein